MTRSRLFSILLPSPGQIPALILLGISFGLFLSVIFLWRASHHATDHCYRKTLTLDPRGRHVEKSRGLWSSEGLLVIYWHQFPSYRGADTPTRHGTWKYESIAKADPFAAIPGYRDAKSGFAGLYAAKNFRGPGSGVIVLPHWLLTAIAALLTAWSARRLARQIIQRRRLHSNQCPTCGYDLRASPQSCPECGTPVPQVKTFSV